MIRLLNTLVSLLLGAQALHGERVGDVLHLISERGLEVLAQRLYVRVLLLELIDADSVRNGLDEATSGACGNDIEGLQPQLQLVLLEDKLKLSNEL